MADERIIVTSRALAGCPGGGRHPIEEVYPGEKLPRSARRKTPSPQGFSGPLEATTRAAGAISANRAEIARRRRTLGQADGTTKSKITAQPMRLPASSGAISKDRICR
jgi:hypothetical protein